MAVVFREGKGNLAFRILPRGQTADFRDAAAVRDGFLQPPPALARSLKNRKTSSRFDFPEALGPIRKTRWLNSALMARKFRQFCNEICENLMRIMKLYLHVMASCPAPLSLPPEGENEITPVAAGDWLQSG